MLDMLTKKFLFLCMCVVFAVQVDAQFTISSTAFATGGNIPARYTAFNGINVNPPLTWTNKPAGTQSLLLVMYDRTFCSGRADSICRSHWVVKDIPASTTGIGEGISSTGPIPAGAVLGKSDNAIRGVAEYTGPFPDSTTIHLYEFKLYALNVATLECVTPYYNYCLQKALAGKVLATASLYGYYLPKPFTPLPVHFVSVEALCAGNKIACKWSTAFETVTAQSFTIQRSADGNRFESIGTVPSTGNTSSVKEYQFIDSNNRYGAGFYRIQQTDRDGRYQYSYVAYVKCENRQNNQLVVQPNPSAGPFTIRLNNPGGQVVQLNIYDVAGKQVSNMQIAGSMTQIQVLEKNAPGVYLLKASFNNGATTITQKLIKLK